jgi:hypothetical protein
LVGLALDVYTMYPSYLVYKTVHKLSSARAAILVLIPIVVLFGLTLLAFALIGSSLAALATAFR